MKVADSACDIGVAGDGQRNERNPAECKPRIALLHMRSHVTTVVTLAYHALIAWYFLAESVLAAHEEEEHG